MVFVDACYLEIKCVFEIIVFEALVKSNCLYS